jgi:hypothetical protein
MRKLTVMEMGMGFNSLDTLFSKSKLMSSYVHFPSLLRVGALVDVSITTQSFSQLSIPVQCPREIARAMYPTPEPKPSCSYYPPNDFTQYPHLPSHGKPKSLALTFQASLLQIYLKITCILMDLWLHTLVIRRGRSRREGSWVRSFGWR